MSHLARFFDFRLPDYRIEDAPNINLEYRAYDALLCQKDQRNRLCSPFQGYHSNARIRATPFQESTQQIPWTIGGDPTGFTLPGREKQEASSAPSTRGYTTVDSRNSTYHLLCQTNVAYFDRSYVLVFIDASISSAAAVFQFPNGQQFQSPSQRYHLVLPPKLPAF